ncbi:hypothetical protein ACP275_04G045500 [Erythranthe tilingii]
MDSTSTSTSRFRFRDHNQEIAAGEDSSEGHTTADSSSISSNEDEYPPELQSMTSKGVQHLCSELLELKQESDEDFQMNIFSNYTAFLAILKEIEGLQIELLELKKQASSQKKLVKDVSHTVSLTFPSEEIKESMLEETPNILEVRTENISEMLDTFISEHRLDDALTLLKMEDEFVRNLEQFSSDELMSYNSTISEKRAIIVHQFASIAKHPRISAPELHKALSGLCQLSENRLATQIMLQYYDSRILSRIFDLQSSKEFRDVFYIQELAKFICSMISRGVTSFVALNGETHRYPSEVTQWASEKIEIFAACFNEYVKSISDTSNRMSTAVDAVQIAVSYCSLLESQRIFLLPYLKELIRPCMEEILKLHIDYLSEVTSIFTSNDNWALGRYYASGILTLRSYAIIDQQPEYFFLTNSGRKFVTLFQSIAEDVSPLIALQMESAVLKGIMDLLTAYIVILESALTGETEILRINLPESPTQGVFILANLSTIIRFCFSIIRNIFDDAHQLGFEIDNHVMFVEDIYRRLKACFLGQFVSNIFSSNVDQESGSGICISWDGDSRIHDMIPSVPYLELYLELKKLEKLADVDSIDVNWLINLLREVIDAAFEWLSSKSEIWRISKDNLADHRIKLMQFILDSQFLVEIARCGGYLSDNVLTISADIMSRLEAYTMRDTSDCEWPAKAATRALHKLQELHVKEESQYEDNMKESTHKLLMINASEIQTNTRVSSTEETLVEEQVDIQEQKTLSNNKEETEEESSQRSATEF